MSSYIRSVRVRGKQDDTSLILDQRMIQIACTSMCRLRLFGSEVPRRLIAWSHSSVKEERGSPVRIDCDLDQWIDGPK
jgi:hypothetical protein